MGTQALSLYQSHSPPASLELFYCCSSLPRSTCNKPYLHTYTLPIVFLFFFVFQYTYSSFVRRHTWSSGQPLISTLRVWRKKNKEVCKRLVQKARVCSCNSFRSSLGEEKQTQPMS